MCYNLWRGDVSGKRGRSQRGSGCEQNEPGRALWIASPFSHNTVSLQNVSKSIPSHFSIHPSFNPFLWLLSLHFSEPVFPQPHYPRTESCTDPSKIFPAINIPWIKSSKPKICILFHPIHALWCHTSRSSCIVSFQPIPSQFPSMTQTCFSPNIPT